MADLATVTNAQFDTLASGVPGPFGPLTRVGSLEEATRLVPNSRTPIEVYSSTAGIGDTHFYISYEELSDAKVTERILREAFGVRYNVLDLQVFAEMFHGAIEAVDVLDATHEDYERTMGLIQFYPKIRDFTAKWDKYELKNSNRIQASFTLAVTSAAVRTMTNTSTGYDIQTYVIDWGDGTFDRIDSTPAAPFTTQAHTYTADGTYEIVLYAAGGGGVDKSPVDSEVVNVP